MGFNGREVEELRPMSPTSQCINTSVLSLCIIAVAESEIPIDDYKIMEILRTDFLSFNTRFSSIVDIDKKGVQWWKKIKVQVENHVVIPIFPSGLSHEDYEKHFEEYLSKISMDQFPENRPLWELHIFMNPTRSAAGTLVFKIHHALGDGFSLMGALFSCLKRADEPSIPLTFPSSTSSSSSSKSSEEKNVCKRALSFVSGCWHTASDFAWSVLQSTLLEDSRSVIRSGNPQLGCMPIGITSITFSLDEVWQVKSKIGVSESDVVVGIIFYGIHLYKHVMDGISTDSRTSALVLLNTRVLNGYRRLDDMLGKNMWGNHFSFIRLSIPCFSDREKVDPLKFIFKVKKAIRRNRSSSLGIFLNSTLLRMVGNLKGREAVSQYMHSTLWNTSLTISNLVGPTEKMAIADHPINSLYFTVTGCPQSLQFTIMSYRGKLRIVITSEKGFINSQLLVSCMDKAFKKIYEATAC